MARPREQSFEDARAEGEALREERRQADREYAWYLVERDLRELESGELEPDELALVVIFFDES